MANATGLGALGRPRTRSVTATRRGIGADGCTNWKPSVATVSRQIRRSTLVASDSVVVAVRVRPLHEIYERFQESVVTCCDEGDPGQSNEILSGRQASSNGLSGGGGLPAGLAAQTGPFVEVSRSTVPNAASMSGRPKAPTRCASSAHYASHPPPPQSMQRQRFYFDVVAGEDETQEGLFTSLIEGPLHTALQFGEALTVMAYGQTASGKTYTMIGEEASAQLATPARNGGDCGAAGGVVAEEAAGNASARIPCTSHPLEGANGTPTNDRVSSTCSSSKGMIFRVLREIFEYKHNTSRTNQSTYIAVLISTVELYRNQLRDLMRDHSSALRRRAALSVVCGDTVTTREAGDSLIVVGNTCAFVDTLEDAHKWIDLATRTRVIAATNMNAASSRGHAMFFIDVFRMRRPRNDVSAAANASEDAGTRTVIPDIAELMAQRDALLLRSGLLAAKTQVTNRVPAGLPPFVAALPLQDLSHRLSRNLGETPRRAFLAHRASTPPLCRLGTYRSDGVPDVHSPAVGGVHPGQRRRTTTQTHGSAHFGDLLERKRGGGASALVSLASSHAEGVRSVTSEEVTSDCGFLIETITRVTLVDLAGSERLKRTGVNDEHALMETNFVNQSLSALAGVVSALSQADATHIPFRSNKLTRLLRPSLVASKVVFIANVSPAEPDTGETICTLRFASTLKHMREAVVPCTRASLASSYLVSEVASRRKTMEELCADVRLASLLRKPIGGPRPLIDVGPPPGQLEQQGSSGADDERSCALASLDALLIRRELVAARLAPDDAKGMVSSPSTLFIPPLAAPPRERVAAVLHKLAEARKVRGSILASMRISLARGAVASPAAPPLKVPDACVDAQAVQQMYEEEKRKRVHELNDLAIASPNQRRCRELFHRTQASIWSRLLAIIAEDEMTARLTIEFEADSWWVTAVENEALLRSSALVKESHKRYDALRAARERIRSVEMLVCGDEDAESEVNASPDERDQDEIDAVVRSVSSAAELLRRRWEHMVASSAALRELQEFTHLEDVAVEQHTVAALSEEVTAHALNAAALKRELLAQRGLKSSPPRQPPRSMTMRGPQVMPKGKHLRNPLSVHFAIPLQSSAPARYGGSPRRKQVSCVSRESTVYAASPVRSTPSSVHSPEAPSQPVHHTCPVYEDGALAGQATVTCDSQRTFVPPLAGLEWPAPLCCVGRGEGSQSGFSLTVSPLTTMRSGRCQTPLTLFPFNDPAVGDDAESTYGGSAYDSALDAAASSIGATAVTTHVSTGYRSTQHTETGISSTPGGDTRINSSSSCWLQVSQRGAEYCLPSLPSRVPFTSVLPISPLYHSRLLAQVIVVSRWFRDVVQAWKGEVEAAEEHTSACGGPQATKVTAVRNRVAAKQPCSVTAEKAKTTGPICKRRLGNESKRRQLVRDTMMLTLLLDDALNRVVVNVSILDGLFASVLLNPSPMLASLRSSILGKGWMSPQAAIEGFLAMLEAEGCVLGRGPYLGNRAESSSAIADVPRSVTTPSERMNLHFCGRESVSSPGGTCRTTDFAVARGGAALAVVRALQIVSLLSDAVTEVRRGDEGVAPRTDVWLRSVNPSEQRGGELNSQNVGHSQSMTDDVSILGGVSTASGRSCRVAPKELMVALRNKVLGELRAQCEAGVNGGRSNAPWGDHVNPSRGSHSDLTMADGVGCDAWRNLGSRVVLMDRDVASAASPAMSEGENSPLIANRGRRRMAGEHADAAVNGANDNGDAVLTEWISCSVAECEDLPEWYRRATAALATYFSRADGLGATLEDHFDALPRGTEDAEAPTDGTGSPAPLPTLGHTQLTCCGLLVQVSELRILGTS